MNIVTKPKRVIVTPLSIYSAILFFICLSDAIMSYITPIHLESVTKNAFTAGLILSCSSFFGIGIDFFIAKAFGTKNYRFFLFWMLVFAAIFPIIFLVLPPKITILIAAMFFWSLYYEFRGFSNFNFVHKIVSSDKHTYAWSVISTFSYIPYALGPIIAVFLIERMFNLSLIASILSVFTSFLIFFLFILKHQKNSNLRIVPETKKSFIVELKILGVLLKKVWPLITFQICIALFDVSFWTTGVLFAEQLRKTEPAATFFNTVYEIPSIYVGVLATLIMVKIGKKRTAFIASLISAILLVIISLVTYVPGILIFVLIASTFYGIANILLSAVFEDYIARLGHKGNDMATLSQFSWNISYAFGPIVLGYIAEVSDYSKPFLFTGTLIIISSLIALLVVPRKIRMPQAELAKIES